MIMASSKSLKMKYGISGRPSMASMIGRANFDDDDFSDEEDR